MTESDFNPVRLPERAPFAERELRARATVICAKVPT